MSNFESIQWRVRLNTSDPSKARKLVDRLKKALGSDPLGVQFERDRRDRRGQYVTFEIMLVARSIQDAIFRSLQMASGVAYHWEVGTPQEHLGARWEFGGLFKGKSRVAGVDWAEFHTQNFRPRS